MCQTYKKRPHKNDENISALLTVPCNIAIEIIILVFSHVRIRILSLVGKEQHGIINIENAAYEIRTI